MTSEDKDKISKRLTRESKTVGAMVRIYCQGHGHQIPVADADKRLCYECQKSLSYASYRILKCPYKADKPSCKVCVIHCFAEPQKTAIKKIMVYAGPRMLLKHPLLSLWHFWYELRPVKVPVKRCG